MQIIDPFNLLLGFLLSPLFLFGVVLIVIVGVVVLRKKGKKEPEAVARVSEPPSERVTERIVEKQYLVICPYCSHKNEQGITKCQGCGAGL